MPNNSKYDALFAQIAKTQFWGTVLFQVKNGKVTLVTFQSSFQSPEAALEWLVAPDEDKPGGVSHVQNVHANGLHSTTR